MQRKGFTLIELLIVVAIIAILAAIALPNFLEAQTRAKVSRVKADISSVGKCIQLYYVDNNSYPRDYFMEAGNEMDTWAQMTTPIAYLSSMPVDIFTKRATTGEFLYFDYGCRKNLPSEERKQGWSEINIDFLFMSMGPNGNIDFSWAECGQYGGAIFENQLIDWSYDPTNGTVSAGDIIYTNRGFEENKV